MRREELKIRNLTSQDQVVEIKRLLDNIMGEGVRFIDADLDKQVIDFDLYQDFDNLDLTTVQCLLYEHGFEAGEIVPGQTCSLRFREADVEVDRH